MSRFVTRVFTRNKPLLWTVIIVCPRMTVYSHQCLRCIKWYRCSEVKLRARTNEYKLVGANTRLQTVAPGCAAVLAPASAHGPPRAIQIHRSSVRAEEHGDGGGRRLQSPSIMAANSVGVVSTHGRVAVATRYPRTGRERGAAQPATATPLRATSQRRPGPTACLVRLLVGFSLQHWADLGRPAAPLALGSSADGPAG